MRKLHTKIKLNIILMVGIAVWYPIVCSHTLYAGDVQKQQTKKVYNVEDAGKLLQTLTQHEIDALFLFDQAIGNVKNKVIKDALSEARDECEKNIRNLSDMIHRYGKEAPEYTKDFKGYFMQGYLAMRGWTSDQGLMKALHSNLQLLLSAYEDALKKELPKDVKEIILQVYEIAKEHVKYVASQM